MTSEVIAYQPKEACRVLGVGMTTLYSLIGAGLLPAKKAGAKTLIPADGLKAYLDSLPDAPITTGQGRGNPPGFQPRQTATTPAN
jgi:excisionase family DNA binding protein